MDLKCTKINSQEPKESNDVRFVALDCIVFELLACENSAENFLVKVAGINCHLIIFSSPVGSLCHTRGVVRRPSSVVRRPSYVVCRLCPP